MGLNKWILINKLRTAVKKISFLLNFNINHLRIASMMRLSSSSSSSSRQSRLSFRNRIIGLQECVDDDDTYDSELVSTPGSCRLLRTESCPSSEDDIDNRAELFIANFYKQLRMERQVSLELRYSKDDRFGLVSP
ncbi:unnamed protein product [Rhodiola kirilowii]